ncbi:hypothetical protein OB919_20355 [Halobacteria archaeon AArc-curdl1]|uniref:Uncharacterized protein n=1 Tax=Natronosalvus hydrolyticus TaxID=2979988 RepID=A0AAP3E8U5_9EURY|nr:hypothetical protein [Halobacteria archaeon AArc-curdl1]
MHRGYAFGLTVAVVGALFAATVLASGSYGLAVDDSIAVPEQTVEIEGSSYEIDGIGVVEPGDSISITVDSSEDYRLYLYNQDEQTEFKSGWESDTKRVTIGTDEDDLDTNDLEPGTYLLSLEVPRQGRQAVYPIVITGYDLMLSYPTTVTADEDIEITATVEPIAELDDPETVQVAIWDGTDVTEVQLDHDGDGQYSAVLESGSLEPGSYNVYGGVSEDSGGDYQTAQAVANGGALTVEEPPDDEDSSDNDETGDDGSSDDDADDDDSNGDDSDGSDDDDADDDDSSDESEESDSDDDDESDTEDDSSDDADDDGDDGDESDGEEREDDTDDTESDGTTDDGDDADDVDDGTDDATESDDDEGAADDSSGETDTADDGSTVIDRNETPADESDDDALASPVLGVLGALGVLGLVLFARVKKTNIW